MSIRICPRERFGRCQQESLNDQRDSNARNKAMKKQRWSKDLINYECRCNNDIPCSIVGRAPPASSEMTLERPNDGPYRCDEGNGGERQELLVNRHLRSLGQVATGCTGAHVGYNPRQPMEDACVSSMRHAH